MNLTMLYACIDKRNIEGEFIMFFFVPSYFIETNYYLSCGFLKLISAQF